MRKNIIAIVFAVYAMYGCASIDPNSCGYQSSQKTSRWYHISEFSRLCILGAHGEIKKKSGMFSQEIDMTRDGWSVIFLNQLFGNFYDPTLAHWVVFISSSGNISEELTRWSSTTSSVKIISVGKSSSIIPGFGHSDSQTLNGENHIWVLVFSQEPIDSGSAVLRVEQSERYLGPSESSLNSIARSFSSRGTLPQNDSPSSASGGIYQNDRPLAFLNVSSDTTPLYGASALVPIISNTRDRLTIIISSTAHVTPAIRKRGSSLTNCLNSCLCRNDEHGQLPKLVHMVQTNFLNGEKGHVGVSLIGGAAMLHGGNLQPSIFLSAHYYFHDNPYWIQSALGTPSIFVGTNLVRQNLLSEFLLGAGFHNFLFFPRDMGVDCAADFQRNGKAPNLFFGIDYRL